MNEFNQPRVSMIELPDDMSAVERLRLQVYARRKIPGLLFVRAFDNGAKGNFLEVCPSKHEQQLRTLVYAFDKDGRRVAE